MHRRLLRKQAPVGFEWVPFESREVKSLPVEPLQFADLHLLAPRR